MVGLLASCTSVWADQTAAEKEFDPIEVSSLEWIAKVKPVPRQEVTDACAKDEAGMKPYTERVPGMEVPFDMVPIPGGTFVMGSPNDEDDRNDDEGPQVEVEIEPFWMGKCEVTWDEYETWSVKLDIARRKIKREAEGREKTAWEELVDAMTRPTAAYTDMTFGMGKARRPAICMTQYAAKMYCKWLTANTGRYYRLPTEAEWEYACRAGTTTAYSFGDDPDDLDDYAWYFDNSDDGYQKVGQKKPNPWGLYDIHGNVAEFVLDQYVADFYKKHAGQTVKAPLALPTTEFPRVVRGGSWDDDPDMLRSAARRGSNKDWKMQDPQIPQSIWYLTDANFAGFRVVRPLRMPTEKEAWLYEPDPQVVKDYKEAQGGKE